MNIQKMLKQAQKMQADAAKMQTDLAAKTVTASVGGGKVTVVATGAGDVLSIKIDKDVVDPEDVEMLEDLVLTGVKQAIEDGKKMAESEMSKNHRRPERNGAARDGDFKEKSAYPEASSGPPGGRGKSSQSLVRRHPSPSEIARFLTFHDHIAIGLPDRVLPAVGIVATVAQRVIRDPRNSRGHPRQCS